MLAKLVLEKYFRDYEEVAQVGQMRIDAGVQSWLFPQVLNITRLWLAECVTLKDSAFPQMLLLLELAHNAADKIYTSIVAAEPGEKTLMPVLRPYDTVGSTIYVDFDTTRSVYATDPAKCHLSYVVADTSSWEQKLAQTLEEMDEVVHYVKNQNLGFSIPYTLNGETRNYLPDFIARVDDGRGRDDLLNLLVEVSGEGKKDKAAKVAAARNLWTPSVNNHGGFGRWAFIEITDPWDAMSAIRGMLRERATVGAEHAS